MTNKRDLRRHLLLGLAATFASTLLLPYTAHSAGVRYEPGSEANWPRNLIRAVQSKLSALGIDPGPIDGRMGSRTRQAIMEYQRMRDMEVDGNLSDELIESLDLD